MVNMYVEWYPTLLIIRQILIRPQWKTITYPSEWLK